MKWLIPCLIALMIPALLPASPVSQTVTGRVVGVHDGDTITVLTISNQQSRVRLSGIDAPELHQAYGNRSKQALSAKVFGKTVVLSVTGKDRYGRTVAEVWLDQQWINLEMVREGWAWMYRRYSASRELEAAEQQARERKLGLWADGNPVPPWEYRRPSQVKPEEPGMNSPQPLFKVEW